MNKNFYIFDQLLVIYNFYNKTFKKGCISLCFISKKGLSSQKLKYNVNLFHNYC